MSKRTRYKLLLLAFCFSCAVEAMAQNARYKASLATVIADNFYKIILSPPIIAKCQSNLADIRIKNEKGDQVPYIIKTDLPVFSESSFIEFPIVSNRKEADKQTHIVIKNAAQKDISNLLLIVKNTEARRTVTLSGSDNRQQWFVIKENIYLDNYFSDNSSFVQTLSFPASNYAFFQVTILGQDVLPVNISKAGIYNQRFTDGKYIDLPPPVIKQKDSTDKRSYVTLTFNNTFHADQLELAVSGSKYFRRTAKVYAANTLAEDPYWFVINSGSPVVLPVQFQAKQILVEIQNEDNPPLKVVAATARQLNQYLLTYLDNGQTYALYFGDSAASPPRYDLEFFKDSIGKSVSEITVGKTEPILVRATAPTKVAPVLNKIVLWLVIAAVLVLLLVLTLRMTKEVNKRT